MRGALARGMRVTALTRNRKIAARLAEQDGVDVVCAELQTGDWHERIDPAQDLVVNCVSSGGGGVAGYQSSYLDDSNISFTKIRIIILFQSLN